MSFSLPGYTELPPGPKLAVTGGRDVHVSDADFEWLLGIFREVGAASYILGDCPSGVDFEVDKRLSAAVEVGSGDIRAWQIFIADWKTLGKRAGPERNQRMINAADALAAFPGGRGSANCIRLAEAKGIPIYRRS